LEFDKFNLHHACHWIISPATRKLCCSLVELVATDADAQYPWWFVSHAWQVGGVGQSSSKNQTNEKKRKEE
jgi:hypothetical protein